MKIEVGDVFICVKIPEDKYAYTYDIKVNEKYKVLYHQVFIPGRIVLKANDDTVLIFSEIPSDNRFPYINEHFIQLTEARNQTITNVLKSNDDIK